MITKDYIEDIAIRCQEDAAFHYEKQCYYKDIYESLLATENPNKDKLNDAWYGFKIHQSDAYYAYKEARQWLFFLIMRD